VPMVYRCLVPQAACAWWVSCARGSGETLDISALVDGLRRAVRMSQQPVQKGGSCSGTKPHWQSLRTCATGDREKLHDGDDDGRGERWQHLKPLRKHARAQIAAHAQHVLDGWRAVVESGDGAASAFSALAPPVARSTPPPDATAAAATGRAADNERVRVCGTRGDSSSSSAAAVKEASGDLPCGASSVRDLRWVNGQWVNRHAPPPLPPMLSPLAASASSGGHKDAGDAARASSARERAAAASSARPRDERADDAGRKKRGRLPVGWESDEEDELDPLTAIRKMFRCE
jgi:hypothetical protein